MPNIILFCPLFPSPLFSETEVNVCVCERVSGVTWVDKWVVLCKNIWLQWEAQKLLFDRPTENAAIIVDNLHFPQCTRVYDGRTDNDSRYAEVDESLTYTL